MRTIFDSLPVKRLPVEQLAKKAGATVLVGGDEETVAWVREFFRRHPKLARYSKVKVNRVLEATGSAGHPEATVQRGIIHLYPKFWALDTEIKDFVFAHEIGHVVESNFDLIHAAEALGVDVWRDREPLPFGQHNMAEAFADSFASYFLDGDVQRRHPDWASLVERALEVVKTATLERSEKERREDERLIQKGTKYKPPRDDLRRKRVKDTDTSERDPDKEQDQKDRSKNYKDATVRVAMLYIARRVALRYKWAKSEREQFLEDMGDKTVKHPETGNEVKITTLYHAKEDKDPKGARLGQKLYYDWARQKRKTPETDKPEAAKPEDDEPEADASGAAGSAQQNFQNKLTSSANDKLIPDLDVWDLSNDSFKPEKLAPDADVIIDNALQLDTSGDDEDAKIKSVIKQLQIANPKLDANAKAKSIRKQIKAIKSGTYDQPFVISDTKGRVMPLNGEDVLFAARILNVPVDVQEVAYKDKDDNLADFDVEGVERAATLGRLSRELKQYRGVTPGDWDEDDEKEAFLDAYQKARAALDPKQLTEDLRKVSDILERAGSYDEDVAPSIGERGFAAAVLEAQARVLGGEGAEKAIREKAKSLLAGHDFGKSESHREVLEKVNTLPAIGQRQFNKALEGQLEQTFADANKGLKDPKAEAVFAQRVAEAKVFFENEGDKHLDPEVAAKHAAVLIADHKLNDPMVRFQVPTGPEALIPDAGVDPADIAVEDEDDALEAYSNITKSKMDVKAAENMAETLKKKLLGLPEGSRAHRKAKAAYHALRLYHIARTKPGEEIEGVHQGFANALRAAHAAGMERIFLETASEVGLTEAQTLDEISKKIARVYKTVPQHELHLYLDDNSPLKEVAEKAFKEAHTPAVAKYLRDLLEADLSASFRFGDIAKAEIDQDMSQIHGDVSRITSGQKRLTMESVKSLWEAMAKLWQRMSSKQSASAQRVASRYVRNGIFPINAGY